MNTFKTSKTKGETKVKTFIGREIGEVNRLYYGDNRKVIAQAEVHWDLAGIWELPRWTKAVFVRLEDGTEMRLSGYQGGPLPKFSDWKNS